MAPHRSTDSSAFAATNMILIIIFCASAVLLGKTTIQAYPIQPFGTRGKRSKIRLGTESQPLAKISRQQQSISSLLLPVPLDTSLRASRNFDRVRNSTSTMSTPIDSRLLDSGGGGDDDDDDDDDNDYDDDEIRLLRFMEEALLELESFQKSSQRKHRNTLNGVDRFDDDQVIDQNDRYPFFGEVENSNSYHELSLLFPQIGAAASTNIDSMFNTTFESQRESGGLHADGKTANVAEEEEKPGLIMNNAADEEGVWRARWLVVAAAALYGTNFSLVKLLGDDMPVAVSQPLRFGFAALITLPWLIEGFIPQINSKKEDLDHSESQFENRKSDEEAGHRVMATMYGLEVGLWNSMGYVAQAVGLETTLASESAFLCSMAVVIVPLLDWVAGKRLLPRQWVGALMALFGVAFLELGDIGTVLSSNSNSNVIIPTGDLISMIQPFTFGLGFWRMEQAMDRFPNEAARMTAAQLISVFISSVGYGIWTVGAFDHFIDGSSLGVALEGFQSSLASISTLFPWNEWATNPSIWLSLFWTGCITTALTIYMENLALESLSAAETTLIFSTEPLWGTAFAVVVMGEQMGMNSAVGAGLILMACVYSTLGIRGLQEMWRNAVAKKTTNSCSNDPSDVESSSSSFLRSLQNHWPWLSSGSADDLATLNSASSSDTKLEELNEIVETLIENLVNKL